METNEHDAASADMGGDRENSRRKDTEGTESMEKSYRSRRSLEMGDADDSNPFISVPPKNAPADAGKEKEPARQGNPTIPGPAESGESAAGDGKPADDAKPDSASSIVESLERKPDESRSEPDHNARKTDAPPSTAGGGRHRRPADAAGGASYADEIGEAFSDASAEEGRNHIQLWLGLSLGLAIAGMSPTLLPFMVLAFGAHRGMIAYLAVMFFIPLVVLIVVAVELATRPKLRQGSSGVTTIILLALVAAIVILYAFAAYKVGNEVTDVVVDTLHRLGNMIIFR